MGFFNRLSTKSTNIADYTWSELFPHTNAKSGVAVNVDTALRVTTVLACARVLAEGVAQLPINLFNIDPVTGAKKPVIGNPLSKILARRPNEWMTSFEMRETMMFHAVLTGNAYAYIGWGTVRGAKVIQEIIPLVPSRVTIQRMADYSLIYYVSGLDGSQTTIPADSILHIRGPSWNGYLGMDAVQLAREAIGLAITTEETHASLHANGAQPGGVLAVKGKLDAVARERLKVAWQAFQGGVANRFKTAVLDVDATWSPLAMTGVDSQHLETRRFQIEEVCRAMRVFPQLVMHTDKTSTFASADAFFLAHVTHSLMPWILRWEQGIERALLDDQDDVICKFNTAALLRGDDGARADFYMKALGGARGETAYMTRNEVRALEDMNPIAGGDKLLIPVPVALPTQGAAGPASKEDIYDLLLKFNDNHGSDGRFTSGGGGKPRSGGKKPKGNKVVVRTTSKIKKWFNSTTATSLLIHGVAGTATLFGASMISDQAGAAVAHAIGHHVGMAGEGITISAISVLTQVVATQIGLDVAKAKDFIVKVLDNVIVKLGKKSADDEEIIAFLQNYRDAVANFDGVDDDTTEETLGGKSFFLTKYNDNHDNLGRFTTGSTSFVSPNVNNIGVQQAVDALTGSQQARRLANASAQIDSQLGLNSRSQNAVGAWSDGAENSLMTESKGSYETVRLAAAMKGYLADQKAVLVFKAASGGKEFWASFRATGTLTEINASLLRNGIANHTLVPTHDGAKVFVFGQSQDELSQVRSTARSSYNVGIKAVAGTGEFIGTTLTTGTDRQQRDDALRVYSEVIANSHSSGRGRNVAALWNNVQHNWNAGSKGVKFNPNHDDHGRFDFGSNAVHSHDQSTTKNVKATWIANSPLKSLKDVFGGAVANKNTMDSAGQAIAKTTGAIYHDTGNKQNGDRVQEKLKEGRTPAGLTDITRSTFIVASPAQATAVVKALGDYFPTADEGWKTTDMGYFDRAANIRFNNGQIGEVLMMPPEMAFAKSDKGGHGHDMYKEARSPTTAPDRVATLTAQQRALYGAALDSLPPAWNAVTGRGGKSGN